MKVLWTDKHIAEATGGHVYSSWVVGRVVIDSRQVQEGDLFIAIKGEHHDGHAYVAQAFEKGAAAAVVQYMPPNVSDSSKLVSVADTTKALVDIARFARDRSRARVVAVTGSVGKTGAKDGLAIVLAGMGKIHMTAGNLNNHFGVPLTLANLPDNANYAVIEMGMNHAGEIRELTKLARPHVAVITAVQPAHMEFFDSVEAVADAKIEIAEGLVEHGALVLPADSPFCGRMKARAAELGIERVFTFGEAAGADYRLMMYRIQHQASEVHAMMRDVPFSFRLGAIGYHWGVASLAIMAAVNILGGDLKKAAQAIAYVKEPAGRGRISTVKLPAGGSIVVIDDSYNASPAAMSAAFAKLRDVFDMNGAEGRMVAILGDMLELGDESVERHKVVADDVLGRGVEVVFCAGSLMRHLHDALPQTMEKFWAADAPSLWGMVRSRLRDGDTVLIKGSHGSKIYELAHHVLNLEKEVMSDAV